MGLRLVVGDGGCYFFGRNGTFHKDVFNFSILHNSLLHFFNTSAPSFRQKQFSIPWAFIFDKAILLRFPDWQNRIFFVKSPRKSSTDFQFSNGISVSFGSFNRGVSFSFRTSIQWSASSFVRSFSEISKSKTQS